MRPSLPSNTIYTYETRGPWLITHDGAKPKSWVMWTLDSAVMRFWMCDPDNQQPPYRVCVDSWGTVILGHDRADDATPKIVGTKEAIDVVLSHATAIEDATEIMWLASRLQAMGGVAF